MTTTALHTTIRNTLTAAGIPDDVALSACITIAPIALAQPSVWMSFCRRGANRNCPNEPPALITPDALPRASAGRRRAAAPISTEKLAPPAPSWVIRPMATTRPKPESMKGVTAQPSARSTTAANNTGRAP